jgi:hypothetical protein
MRAMVVTLVIRSIFVTATNQLTSGSQELKQILAGSSSSVAWLRLVYLKNLQFTLNFIALSILKDFFFFYLQKCKFWEWEDELSSTTSFKPKSKYGAKSGCLEADPSSHVVSELILIRWTVICIALVCVWIASRM